MSTAETTREGRDRRNRAAVLVATEQIAFEERPMPTLKIGDALVRVIASGVCGSDVHQYRASPSPSPFVVGHELVARVESAPSRPDLVGQRVAIDPHRSCGSCAECAAGAYNLCPLVRFLAHPPTDGGFTEYLAVPAERCHPIPPSMNDEEGALVEPTAVAVWAFERARTRPGERVLVIGAGPVGRLVARVAVALGAEGVTMIDPVTQRLAAEADGRIRTATSLSELQGAAAFPVVMECSGATGIYRTIAPHVAPGGRVVAVGIGRSPIAEIDLFALQEREAELLGSFRYRDTFPTAIAMIADGRLPVADLVTHRFTFDDVESALRIGAEDPTSVKTIVRVAPEGAH